MKKVCLVAAAVTALLASCSFTQVDQSQDIAVQIIAKRVGYYVGFNNPDIIPVAKMAAQGIISASSDSDVIKAALNAGIEELAKQFPEDPLLESDLKLIVSALQINMPDSKIDVEQVKPFVVAFIEGLEISVATKE